MSAIMKSCKATCDESQCEALCVACCQTAGVDEKIIGDAKAVGFDPFTILTLVLTYGPKVLSILQLILDSWNKPTPTPVGTQTTKSPSTKTP